MPTTKQLQSALQRAQAAGDTAAVQDLSERLGLGGSPQAAQPSPPEAAKPFARAGGYGPTVAGIGDSAIKTFLGAKQLVGLESEDDKRVRKMMEEEHEADPEKGWRTAGEVVGDIAQTAIPANYAAKGIQGAQLLANFPKLAAILGAGGSGAATELVTSHGEGDTYGEQLLSKVKQAAKAGATAAAITGGISAVAKPLTGLFKATPEAERLYAQGINPTLQQGAAGFPGKYIGGLTAGVRDVKGRIKDEGAEAILKRATEGKVSVGSGTGSEYADAARNYVSNEYDVLWANKRIQLSPKQREALVSAAGRLPSDGRGKRAATEATGIVEDLFGVEQGKAIAQTNYPLNPKTWREEFRSKLTNAAMGADDDVKRRLLDVREEADKLITLKRLSPAEKARLSEVNRLNFDATRLEEAIAGGGQAKEGIDFRRLNTAYSRMLNQGRSMGNTTYDDIVAPTTRVLDNTPNQNMARSLKAAVGKLLLPTAAAAGMGGLGTAAGVATIPYAISLMGQFPGGARKLLGQEAWQKALADKIRRYSGPIGGTLGAAMTDSGEQDAP